jgi:hypothetical protein
MGRYPYAERYSCNKAGFKKKPLRYVNGQSMNTSDSGMTQFHRLIFLPAIFLLFACIMPYVSAFTVASVEVNPLGYQAAGTPMTINAVITFSSQSAVTFPSANELQMSTNLVDAYWVPVLVLEGVETHLEQKTGGSLTVPGWYLEYPSAQNVKLRVTLTGKVPPNPSPAQDLLKIQETGPDAHVVSTAHVGMPQAPVITLNTRSTPTKKPTTKPIFTPIPADTTVQESPLGTGAGIIAVTGAALLGIRRK